MIDIVEDTNAEYVDDVDAEGVQVRRLMTADELADLNARRAAAADPAPKRAALVRLIDADADAIYAAVIGNRTTEYKMAESDATAYKDAGYTGTVPASVQCWADVKAQTAQWAADDILATAAAWLSAQAAIRANRLARKEDARTAADEAAINTAAAQWSAFVSTIRASLGVA